MSGLKDKAISGASWSLTGRLLQQGVQFLIGIILARLLMPEEYGLVAMALVFITVFYVFVDSGFSTAIIQRKEITKSDLSTVFYLNLGVSVIAFIILYLLAPLIAKFYGNIQLVRIVRTLSLMIILYALTIVQNSLLVRDIRFKIKTRIELVSQILSGIIAIYLAYKGYGVWALIWKTLLNQIFVNIQLWMSNRWLPSFEFNKNSFKELFGFSNKLLVSGIIDRVYQQINRLVVGKFFPAAELGYYTKAEQFNNLPSHTISNSLMSFLLPVFSKMQDDIERLRRAIVKVIKIVMYFNVNAMLLMFILSEPLIIGLLGEQWRGAVPYLRLLVFVGLFYPMHTINVQILTALGRSDLFLKVEVYKKIIGSTSVLLGIFVGIQAMICGMIVTSFISLAINTYYTNKLLRLGLFEQLKCISKTFFVALIMVILMLPLTIFLKSYLNNIELLILISSISFFLVLFISNLLRLEEYTEIKLIVTKLIKRNG
ncbi:MAG TPA: lipopolysaccharide biosynthesis protein [Bacteroidetes bacterium]|nr:lipopolysaccharide biosynthesis protein [Bacteroidota bacterium]